ncbi:MAG: hypothetical protein AAGD11_01315 [Planctomycetota bacterium]
MSRCQTLIRTTIVAAATLLVALASVRVGYALGDCACGCSPSTPCACAADGVCRPKRDSWGHYKTRWRAWPGEPSGQTPTLADQQGAAAPEVTPLPDYETPLLEQEDLRAPKKKKQEKAEEADDAMPIELPGELPGQLLPGPGDAPADQAAPDLDPFSGVPEVPPMEDAPPALPASLRQAAESMGMPTLSQKSQTGLKPAAILQASAEMPIQQADWQSSELTKLVNPAAAAIEPAGAPLQQAVYYEAADQGK